MPPLLTELPYRIDSAVAVRGDRRPGRGRSFLDSGLHHPGQSRYDILAAQPYVRLVTRGTLTEIHADGIELSREDPFELLRRCLDFDRRVRRSRSRSAAAPSATSATISHAGSSAFPSHAQRRGAHSRDGDRHLRLGRRRRSSRAAHVARRAGARSRNRLEVGQPGAAFQRAAATNVRAGRSGSLRRSTPISRATHYAQAFDRIDALHRRRRLLSGQSRAALQRDSRGRPVARVPGAARDEPGAVRGLSQHAVCARALGVARALPASRRAGASKRSRSRARVRAPGTRGSMPSSRRRFARARRTAPRT